MTHASNVLGTVQAIEAIAPIVRASGALFLVDAAQSAGVVPIDLRSTPIDLLAFPGHKALYGPTGTGAALCRATGRRQASPLARGRDWRRFVKRNPAACHALPPGGRNAQCPGGSRTGRGNRLGDGARARQTADS